MRRSSRPRVFARGGGFFATIALLATPALTEPLTIFAAASLTDALDAALEVCDPTAIGVYAGSGTAARQIANGAPANLYISASPEWMYWLAARGMIVEETRTDLLSNRLVLIANRERDGDAKPDALIRDRIALADTETVPAGQYARQAFEARGWWDRAGFQDALVQAGNVREALSWVARGEAGYGVVYASDAHSEPRVIVKEVFDADEHDPIRYPAAVVRNGPKAQSLLACLKGEEALDVFERFGFTSAP